MDPVVIPEHCVICYTKLTNKELKCRSQASLEQVQKVFSKDVVFILKILLEVPVNLLETFLEGIGGCGGSTPGFWISVCGNCAGDVVEVKGIYQEIMESSRRFRSGQRRLLDKLIASYDGGGDDTSSRLEVTDECRKFVNDRFSNGVLEDEPLLVVEDAAAFTTNLLSRLPSLEDVNPEEEPVVTTTLLEYNGCEQVEEDPLSILDYQEEEVKDEYNEDAEIKSERDSETGSVITNEEEDSANDSDWKPEVSTHPQDDENHEEEEEKETNSKLEEKSKCKICRQSFPTRRGLSQHMSRMHMKSKSGKSWTCSEEGCGIKFTNFREFQQHKPNHRHGPPKRKCKFCDKAFHTDGTRQRHLKSVHGVFPSRRAVLSSECPICHSAHTSVHAVRRHIKLRHKDSQEVYVTPEKFPCSWKDCGKSFSRPESLRIHVSRHEGKPGFKCPECEESFYSPQALSRHQDEVHSEGQFPCEFCGKAFKNREFLKIHLRSIHRVQRRSYLKERRKEEKKTGNEEKNAIPLECNVCGKEFQNRKGLQVHVKRNHEDKMVKCDFCERSFLFNSDLTAHQKRFHEFGGGHRKWTNRKGSGVKGTGVKGSGVKGSGVKGTGVKVKSMRSFQCEVVGCRERFSSQQRLELHATKMHGESGNVKRFQCVHCGKGFHQKFKLTEHEHLHVNQESRPFKCDMCGKGFANRHNLRCHQINTHKAERMVKRRPETKPRSYLNKTQKKTDNSAKNDLND